MLQLIDKIIFLLVIQGKRVINVMRIVSPNDHFWCEMTHRWDCSLQRGAVILLFLSLSVCVCVLHNTVSSTGLPPVPLCNPQMGTELGLCTVDRLGRVTDCYEKRKSGRPSESCLRGHRRWYFITQANIRHVCYNVILKCLFLNHNIQYGWAA